MDDELQELRQNQYHRSRIPALDALEAFVADGAPPDSELAELRSRTGFSRWYPVPGGHRVLVLYEGGGFNADRFTLRKGAWDHEHCKRCSARIPSLTLCWVSRGESYIVLCDDCHNYVNRSGDAVGYTPLQPTTADAIMSRRGCNPGREATGTTLGGCDPMLRTNRSAPSTAVIPVLYYPDVRQAVHWLTTALPFAERLRIGDHRSQLVYGNGAVVVAETGGHADAHASTLQGPAAHSVMIRVTRIEELFERARAAGARVLAEPADHLYGERQCSFLDPWGRPWTLSETVFDSDPANWGGELLLE